MIETLVVWTVVPSLAYVLVFARSARMSAAAGLLGLGFCLTVRFAL